MRLLAPFVVGCMLLAPTFAPAQDRTALPEGAVARLGAHRLRVPGDLFVAAFTPDQKTLVASYYPGGDDVPNVALFSVATGLERTRLPIKGARRIAMARTKPLMAVSTTKGFEAWFELWDMSTEKRVRHWVFPDNGPTHISLAISPDGTQVAASGRLGKESIIRRWSTATGEPLPALDPKTSMLSSVSFSADGSEILSIHQPVRSGDGKATLIKSGGVIAWDARSGKKLAELEYDAHDVVVSPDGAKVALSRQYEWIEIVDLPALWKKAVRIPHAGFTFTPDGKRLVIMSNHKLMHLWDIAAGREVHSFGNQAWDRFDTGAFSPDEKLFVGLRRDQGGANLYLWDLDADKQVRFPTGHPGAVNGLAYAPDGKRIATISADSIAIFDPHAGTELRRWVAHKAIVEQIAFSPDGKLLASGAPDGKVALWDPATGKERRRLDASDSVKAVAFTRDGASVVAVSRNGVVQTWDVKTGALTRTHKTERQLAAPILAPNARYLAFVQGKAGEDGVPGNGGSILHWLDVRAGKSLPSIELRRHRDAGEEGVRFENTVVWDYAFSADGKLLVTSDSIQTWAIRMVLADHTIRVWETATGREILRLTDNPGSTRLLALSPDGRTLAHGHGGRQKFGHGGDTALILRDISGVPIRVLPKNRHEGLADLEEMQNRFRQFTGHQGSITSLTFSPDSKFLATGGSDQIVYVWRVEHFVDRPRPPVDKDNLDQRWQELGDPDPRTAFLAMGLMELRPTDSLALLRKHVRPVPTIDEKVIRQHLRDLGSANFAVRQQAHVALDKIGEQASPFLQESLKAPHGLEMRRRIETLLDRYERPLENTDQFRLYRAVTLLQRIGTPEARKHMEELAQGAPASWLTIEARHALSNMRPKE